MKYFFAEAARAEHLEHVAYYEGRRAGLGARYVEALEHAMERICANPDRFPIAHSPSIRRVPVPGFPLNILYREVQGEVEVLVLAHHRRRPGYWHDRSV